jgi:hypothetical protein
VNEIKVQCLGELEDTFVSVELAEYDARETCVRHEFEAAETWRSGNVDRAGLYAHTSASGLSDSVGFGVNGADTMPVLHQVPNLVAVRQPANAPVVSGSQDDSITHDDGAHMFSIARRAGGNDAGNRHEVLIPRGAFRGCHGCGYTAKPESISSCPYLTGCADRGYLRSVKRRILAALVAPALVLAILGSKPAFSAEPVPNRDQLLTQISALEKPAEQAKLLKQPLDAARKVLSRAEDARAAGDVEHGIEFEALAFDYVTIAKDMLRATELEASLRAAQTELTRTETARRQTEILLEVTVAQRERTKAELMRWRAERDAKNPAVSAKPATHKKGQGAKQ